MYLMCTELNQYQPGIKKAATYERPLKLNLQKLSMFKTKI